MIHFLMFFCSKAVWGTKTSVWQFTFQYLLRYDFAIFFSEYHSLVAVSKKAEIASVLMYPITTYVLIIFYCLEKYDVPMKYISKNVADLYSLK